MARSSSVNAARLGVDLNRFRGVAVRGLSHAVHVRVQGALPVIIPKKVVGVPRKQATVYGNSKVMS